jgi:predicted acyl esterase
MKKTILIFLTLWIAQLSTLLMCHTAMAASHLPILEQLSKQRARSLPTSEHFTIDDSIEITTEDGLKLKANIFLPTQLDENAPAVIFINSWALNEYQYIKQAAYLAERGYIVLSYATRGFGGSEGVVATAGPDDIADYSKAIDFLIDNYPVDENAIGTGGISYGSGISLIGAAHDSRVKAVAALSSWGSLVDSLYGNQSPRLAWGEILTLSGQLTGNLDTNVPRYWEAIKSHDENLLPEVIDWALERSPSEYVDKLNANGTAIYLAKSYGDNLFQPNSLVTLFEQLTTPKYIDLLPGTHGTAEVLPDLFGVGENLVWQNVYHWFDLHLKQKPNRLPGDKPINMKVKFNDRTDQFTSLSDPNILTQKYFLHPRTWFDNGDLETTPYSTSQSQDNTLNAWAGTLFTTSIPVLSQLLEQLEVPVYSHIYAASDVRGIYYQSPKTATKMKIRGNPTLSLYVQPHTDQAQVVAYLYDMNRFGIAKLITHGVYTLPKADPGAIVKLDIEMATTAYDVPEGHRVVLAIDTQDPQYKKPNRWAYNIDIEYGNNRVAELIIPFVK